MLKRSLIDKYRPKNFSDIVGQQTALKPIYKAIKRGALMQRICLIGDSGVGKTTTAVCLARALNCDNFNSESMIACGDCSTCKADLRNLTSFNLISCAENGTSQGEIDKYIRLASMSSVLKKYRVIFFDEVHEWQDRQSKLTTFLDTLTPYTFVLCATYRPDKLETAFRKRFHVIHLDLPNEEDIFELLTRITKAEGVQLPERKLKEISSNYAGDPREAVNALERLFLEY